MNNNINNISMINPLVDPPFIRYPIPPMNVSQKREGVDRRQNTLRSLLVSPFMRRRKASRRDVDRANSYVDVHETSLFAVFSLTILFSIVDALFTLIIIENGGEELNPFMKLLMDRNVSEFFWVKFSITSFGMAFLVVHKHFVAFRLISGYHFLYGIFLMYFSLIIYEMYLLGLIYKVY